MIRNLKALGLAMAAFLALGAVCASAASAQQGMLTSDGPVTLTGTEVGAVEDNRLTAFGRFVQCPGSTYTGHRVLTHEETTMEVEHPFLQNKDTEATITPHYNQAGANCSGSAGSSHTVHMNGCDYVVKIGGATPAGTTDQTYAATFDVVCPPEKEITVTTWYSEGDHTNNPTNPRCILHVPPQTGLTGAHATDEGNGHIKLEGEVEGITVNQTRPNDPLFQCTQTHDPEARFDLNVKLEGHNSGGGQTKVSLSRDEMPQGMLTSDGPVTLTWTEVGAAEENRVTMFSRFFQCPGSTYTGHRVLTHEETTLGVEHPFLQNKETEATITPHYNQAEANCSGSAGSSQTIHMNGCDYVAKIGETANSAGTYDVTFDVVCPPEKDITVTVWYSEGDHTNIPNNPRCILHVPEQGDLKGAHATDEGNGHIKLEGEVEGITVNQTRPNDPLFQCTATHDPAASFDINITVEGHNEAGQQTDISLSHS